MRFLGLMIGLGFGLSSLGWGQTAIVRVGQDNTYTSGYQNFNAGTLGLPRGNTDPATCSVGDRFVNTTTTPGVSKICTSTNTWVLDVLSGGALTSDRIPFVTTGGLLMDSAYITYPSNVFTLTAQGSTPNRLQNWYSIDPLESPFGVSIFSTANSGGNTQMDNNWAIGLNPNQAISGKPAFTLNIEPLYSTSVGVNGQLEAYFDLALPSGTHSRPFTVTARYVLDESFGTQVHINASTTYVMSRDSATEYARWTDTGAFTNTPMTLKSLATDAYTLRALRSTASQTLAGFWEESDNSASLYMTNGSNAVRVKLATSTTGGVSYLAGGSAVGIGPSNTSPTGTLHVYDATATTGVTRSWIREGAGQSTNEVWGIYANNGTTVRLSYGNGLLRFAGTSSSEPALKRSTTGLIARLADDSADTWFQASQFRSTLTTPASASATCVTGTIVADTDYIYVCTATNTWKRVAIATW